jgi:hypothetical protein
MGNELMWTISQEEAYVNRKDKKMGRIILHCYFTKESKCSRLPGEHSQLQSLQIRPAKGGSAGQASRPAFNILFLIPWVEL